MKHKLKDRVVAQWKDVEGEVRTRWSKLSNGDFQWVAGRRDKLAAILQQRYSLCQEEAQREVDEWVAQFR